MTYPSCGECERCKAGETYNCLNFGLYTVSGTMPDGTQRMFLNGEPVNHNFLGQSSFATHTIVHKSGLNKLRDKIDMKSLGPLGCGLATGAGAVINYFKPKPDESIVIFGLGGVGFGGLLGAKMCGVKTIICITRTQEKLDIAMEMGATHTINSKGMTNEEVVAAILEITGGTGASYGLDSTGNADVIKVGNLALDYDAKFVLYGGGSEDLRISPQGMLYKSVEYKSMPFGKSTATEVIPKYLEYIEQGNFSIEKIVTYYNFEDVNKAIEDMENGKVIKPVLVMPDFQ